MAPGRGTPRRAGRRDCSSIYLPCRRRRPRFGRRAAAAWPSARCDARGRRAAADPVDALGQPVDGLADRVLGVRGGDRLAGVGGVGDLGRGRDGLRDLHVQGRLDLVRGQPDLVVGPVEHQVPARLREVQQVEGLAGDLDVLQRRHVERGDQQQLVGLVERLQHVLVERGRRVHDDVVEVLP